MTGPYHTNLDEGTLNPYDQSALSGWCGEDVAGDRVTFLTFDLSDFDAAALDKVALGGWLLSRKGLCPPPPPHCRCHDAPAKPWAHLSAP